MAYYVDWRAIDARRLSAQRRLSTPRETGEERGAVAHEEAESPERKAVVPPIHNEDNNRSTESSDAASFPPAQTAAAAAKDAFPSQRRVPHGVQTAPPAQRNPFGPGRMPPPPFPSCVDPTTPSPPEAKRFLTLLRRLHAVRDARCRLSVQLHEATTRVASCLAVVAATAPATADPAAAADNRHNRLTRALRTLDGINDDLRCCVEARKREKQRCVARRQARLCRGLSPVPAAAVPLDSHVFICSANTDVEGVMRSLSPIGAASAASVGQDEDALFGERQQQPAVCRETAATALAAVAAAQRTRAALHQALELALAKERGRQVAVTRLHTRNAGAAAATTTTASAFAAPPYPASPSAQLY